MSAKKQVMNLIKKKQRSNQASRLKSTYRTGVDKIVLQFIQEYEEMKSSTSSVVEFDIGLKRCLGFLESRLKVLDPKVDITIHWFDESRVTRWQELAVEGVTIKWSALYMGLNPLADKSRYVDVGALLIEELM